METAAIPQRLTRVRPASREETGRNKPPVAPESRRAYGQLLEFLQAQFETLALAHPSHELMHAYACLLDQLSSLSAPEIDNLLSRPSTRPKARKLELSDTELSALPLESIEDLLDRPELTRKFIERLAELRFHITRSDIQSARNREALVERVRALVESERAIQTIQNVASGGTTALKQLLPTAEEPVQRLAGNSRR